MATAVAPEVEIRDVDSTWTAAVRVSRTFEELHDAFSEFLPLVAARIEELGGAPAGGPYARYHAVTDASVDVEIGVPVTALLGMLLPIDEIEAGEVGASMLPGGRVAVLTHTGSYAGLGMAWARVDAWLEASSLHRVGPGWELYLNSPGDVEEEHLRTEVVIPVS